MNYRHYSPAVMIGAKIGKESEEDAGYSVGKGLVLDGNTLHVAQSTPFPLWRVPYAKSTSEIGFINEFFWDDQYKTLFFNTALDVLGAIIVGRNGEYLGAMRSDGSASFTQLNTNNDINVGKQLILSQSVVSYSSTTNIDFDVSSFQTVSLTGNVTFTTSHKDVGKSVTVRIISDGSSRNLTFPSWVFVGAAAPTSIAANKTAILSLTCFGGASDSDVVAAYAVQA